MRASARASMSALVVLALTGCPDPCDNDLKSEATSPDGRWRAVAFNRSCGATTGDSTQVSLLPREDSLPKGSGNVAVFDSGHQPIALDVVLRWQSPDELVVEHPARVRWFRQDAARDGIRIRYVRSPVAP